MLLGCFILLHDCITDGFVFKCRWSEDVLGMLGNNNQHSWI